jgi:hypothetical protein
LLEGAQELPQSPNQMEQRSRWKKGPQAEKLARSRCLATRIVATGEMVASVAAAAAAFRFAAAWLECWWQPC